MSVLEGFDFGYFVNNPEMLRTVANFTIDSGIYCGGGPRKVDGNPGLINVIYIDPCGKSEIWLDKSNNSIHLKQIPREIREKIERIIGFNA